MVAAGCAGFVVRSVAQLRDHAQDRVVARVDAWIADGVGDGAGVDRASVRLSCLREVGGAQTGSGRRCCPRRCSGRARRSGRPSGRRPTRSRSAARSRPPAPRRPRRRPAGAPASGPNSLLSPGVTSIESPFHRVVSRVYDEPSWLTVPVSVLAAAVAARASSRPRMRSGRGCRERQTDDDRGSRQRRGRAGGEADHATPAVELGTPPPRRNLSRRDFFSECVQGSIHASKPGWLAGSRIATLAYSAQWSSSLPLVKEPAGLCACNRLMRRTSPRRLRHEHERPLCVVGVERGAEASARAVQAPADRHRGSPNNPGDLSRGESFALRQEQDLAVAGIERRQRSMDAHDERVVGGLFGFWLGVQSVLQPGPAARRPRLVGDHPPRGRIQPGTGGLVRRHVLEAPPRDEKHLGHRVLGVADHTKPQRQYEAIPAHTPGTVHRSVADAPAPFRSHRLPAGFPHSPRDCPATSSPFEHRGSSVRPGEGNLNAKSTAGARSAGDDGVVSVATAFATTGRVQVHLPLGHPGLQAARTARTAVPPHPRESVARCSDPQQRVSPGSPGGELDPTTVPVVPDRVPDQLSTRRSIRSGSPIAGQGPSPKLTLSPRNSRV